MAFKPTQFNNDSQLVPIAACCGGTGLTTPGTTGNVLTSNGTTWVSSAGGGGGTTSANGRISLFGPFRGTPTSYCWRSPGAGTAVIEIWGGGGGGGGGQCCGSGIPGNSGAYSRSTITVTASGFVCGVVGGATYATGGCCVGCRGCHSDACLAPAGSITTTMCAQGGFGGIWMCNATGNSLFCCYFAGGYCSTPYSSLPPLSSPGCGFVCNFGSTSGSAGTITAATAAGGDCNISGGISCVDYCNCNPQSNLSFMRYYHSFPACDTRQPGHVLVCYCDTSNSQFSRGEAAFELAYNRLTMGGGAPLRAFSFPGCGCFIDCGCYAYGVNAPGIVGAGYGSQASMSGGETNTDCGSAGGPGLVKITWIG